MRVKTKKQTRQEALNNLFGKIVEESAVLLSTPDGRHDRERLVQQGASLAKEAAYVHTLIGDD